MAAPTLVDSASGSIDSNITTPHTVDAPASLSDGHLIVVAITFDANGARTITPPSGFEEIVKVGANPVLGVYAKEASSEGASWDFAVDSNEKSAWVSMCFNGWNDTGTITDAFDITGTDNGSSTTPTAPDVTTTVNDCLVLSIAGTDGATMTSPFSGYPGSTTAVDAAEASGGGEASCGVAYFTKATAGSTGTTAWTTGSDTWWAAHVAIQPASGGGGGGGNPHYYYAQQ